MSYKSIATIMHDPKGDRDALEMAIWFAARRARIFTCFAWASISTDPGYYYAGAQAIAVQQNFDEVQGIAEWNWRELIARNCLTAEDILWDVESVTDLTRWRTRLLLIQCGLLTSSSPQHLIRRGHAHGRVGL